MTKDQLIEAVEAFLKGHEAIESASRITDEDAIGIELRDGTEYFIEIQEA